MGGKARAARPTVIVTGAGGPLGVNACRSLARAGPALRLVGTDANRWHLPLSVCEQTYLIPYARDRERYARALVDVARREGATCVLPTHPVEVRAVAELAAANALPGLGVALPRPEVIALCDDKAATQARLDASGVSAPRTVRLDSPGDIDRAFAELSDGGPVWVRGSGAPGLGIGGAALPCRDREVARAWVAHHRGWGHMSASEYLPGDNLSWMAVFDRGAVVASGARQRLEYVLPHVAPSGVTGAPAVSHTIARPDVAALGERAVRAVDDAPHGAYFVDFKAGADGAPRVTEINAGRCGTTVLAYTEAGVNFPWLLVALATGAECPPPGHMRRTVEPGVYWVRTLDCGPVAIRGEAGFDRFPRAPSDGDAG